MTKHGYTKEQQTQLKQLVKDCSISRVPISSIQQIAQDKLGITVTENWIGRIKTRLKRDSEKEFKYLLSDNFAFKHELLKRIEEVKHIQKLQWELYHKEHPTKEDLIRLKCLTELLESTTLLQELYNVLPDIDTGFTPKSEYYQGRAKTVYERELRSQFGYDDTDSQQQTTRF